MTFRSHKIKSALLCVIVLILIGTVTAAAGGILGDADGNGTVTILDVTCIQKAIAELPVSDGYSESAADADGNGKVDIKDATIIQRWLTSTEVPYPIGEQITEPTTQPLTDPDGWGYVIYRP